MRPTFLVWNTMLSVIASADLGAGGASGAAAALEETSGAEDGRVGET